MQSDSPKTPQQKAREWLQENDVILSGTPHAKAVIEALVAYGQAASTREQELEEALQRIQELSTLKISGPSPIEALNRIGAITDWALLARPEGKDKL